MDLNPCKICLEKERLKILSVKAIIVPLFITQESNEIQ